MAVGASVNDLIWPWRSFASCRPFQVQSVKHLCSILPDFYWQRACAVPQRQLGFLLFEWWLCLKHVNSYTGWYKTCTEALQRYQSEAAAVKVDEEARQKEREECIKELKTELKDLDGADVGSGPGLLRHIYKTYPPKNPKHKLNDKDLDNETKMKKALLTAIHHYHPDKQDKEQHGRKWVMLCEEITKLLARRHQLMKAVPD